jgi:tetratricopeptide (TPR) repeat protein
MLSKFRALMLGQLALLIAPSASGQTPAPPTREPLAPGLIKLTADDEKRAAQLDEQIDQAMKADRWAETIAKAEELLKLRRSVQGPKHFETVNVEWSLNALRRLGKLTKDDRIAFQSANTMREQAYALYIQGNYIRAQPLFEKALEIHLRLLTDNHPDTASSYNILALNLDAQGRYAEAQPLYEKALEIYRRLLTDDHPDTASSYNNVAYNLDSQAKYVQARRLLEKALKIRRRLLTDDHADTANSYNNLAYNLHAQGEYAAAQPLFEKALAIRRHVLTDDHPDTATSFNNVPYNLGAQGQYAAAQPLFEKALEINRRVLTDNHPDTAASYNNLAANYGALGQYAAAQPFFEKALEITRRLLSDDHRYTALCYANMASNLNALGQHDRAQSVHEKALKIRRRVLTDDHPETTASYNNLATSLQDQGKYTQAQPLYEKALEIRRRLLGDEHPDTALSYHNLAANLDAQGNYPDARDQWRRAVKSLDAARLRVGFTGLKRGGMLRSTRPALAAVLARLSQPAEAWEALEEDLGRGLLDDLSARRETRLTAGERDRIRDVTEELERLDRLAESTPKDLNLAERAKRFEELKRRRDLASITLGELETKLDQKYGALAGHVAKLEEIQAVLPDDGALVAWVDIAPAGPKAADSDGEHWGVVVRSRGIPTWVAIVGTGKDGLWTAHDTGLASRVRTVLRTPPSEAAEDVAPLIAKLRTQRLAPLAKPLGATIDRQAAVRRLVVLPSQAMAGIPIEALLAPDDTRTVSYAPSGTVFKYICEQRRPDAHGGLLAVGDPVYQRSDKSGDSEPLPDHGILLNVVSRRSNAESHGLRDGDVLLAYNGMPMNKKDDLKVVSDGEKPIPIEVWRNGVSLRRELAPGELGAKIDSRPAPEAISDQRRLQQMLAAARSGGEEFAPLPATRREVQAIAQLFQSQGRPTSALLGAEASEPELDRLAASGELVRFAFIHLAAHGVIDQGIPQRSAVILTQVGLPDPLDQVLNHKPVFDGRLLVREIQRSWELKAELVTLSACDTALGKESGGEGFVGFTQALLMSGARSVCVSLWKVDDTATALLMTRFYQNLLGKREGLVGPLPKAESLREAKDWLRHLPHDEVATLTRSEPRKSLKGETSGVVTRFDHPYYWAAFVLVGDPD